MLGGMLGRSQDKSQDKTGSGQKEVRLSKHVVGGVTIIQPIDDDSQDEQKENSISAIEKTTSEKSMEEPSQDPTSTNNEPETSRSRKNTSTPVTTSATIGTLDSFFPIGGHALQELE